jgi:hypothetical protein
MPIQGMKPGRGRALLLGAMLLSSLMCFGSHAAAAVACKTQAQKSSKACAPTAHKKPVPKLKSKSTANAAAKKPGTPVAPATPVTPVTPLSATAVTSAAPTTPCFAALAASQATQHMAAKVPFFVGQAPGPEVLANSSHPSKKEHEELSSLIAGYQMCQDMSAPAPDDSKSSQPLRLSDEQWRGSKAILDALRAGKLSYGAAARALVEAGRPD